MRPARLERGETVPGTPARTAARHRRVQLASCFALVGVAVLLGACMPKAPLEPARPGPTTASPAPEGPEAAALPRMWPVPAFAFPDHHGGTVTPLSFAGHPWVANFIFTECRTVCPLLTSKMVQLQRRLPHPELRFASFSVDPAHDTPMVLADYARRWNPTETRWSLLATDQAGLAAAVQGFHVVAEPQEDPDSPIMHSAVFVLVDAQGSVRGTYDTEDPIALDRLVRNAQALLGVAVTERQLPRDGRGLFEALSCKACHERSDLAPSLKGLLGKKRDLANGEAVVADAEYVRESILAPQQKRVRGYPLQMPSYDGVVPPEAVDTLVDWILTLPAEGAAAAEAAVAVDPVCHMEVRVSSDTPAVEHAGKKHYFCSSLCRNRFAKNPRAFLP